MGDPKVTPEQARTLVSALRAAFRPSEELGTPARLRDEPRSLTARDVERMVAEGRQAMDELDARRQAQYDRNAPRRAQAMAAYERAQAEHAARTVPGWNVAASVWLGPPPPLWIE